MADTWLTVEQASVALRLSVRTVNRHIHAQKIQSRLNDGRREVLVRLSGEDDSQQDADIHLEQASSPQAFQAGEPQSRLKAHSGTVGSAATDNLRVYQETDRQSEVPNALGDLAWSDKPSALQSRLFASDGELSYAGDDDLSSSDNRDNIVNMSAPTRPLIDPRRLPFAIEEAKVDVLATEVSKQKFERADAEVTETEGEPSADSHRPTEAAPPVSSAAAAPVDVETVLTLADQAADKADIAIVAYQTLARVADTQVRSLRQSARMAWMLVGIMAIGVMASGWWVTRRMTSNEIYLNRLQREADYHQHLAASSAAEVARSVAERDRSGQQAGKAREEAALAREQQARLEGKLAAMAEANKRPTTRPGIIGRLTSIFGGQP